MMETRIRQRKHFPVNEQIHTFQPELIEIHSTETDRGAHAYLQSTNLVLSGQTWRLPISHILFMKFKLEKDERLHDQITHVNKTSKDVFIYTGSWSSELWLIILNKSKCDIHQIDFV